MTLASQGRDTSSQEPRGAAQPTLRSRFSTWAVVVADAIGQPWAFAVATLSVIVWAVSGPLFRFSDTWQLVINTGTTVLTFLIVFLIQNAQNRDAKATQLKLDELIRAVETAGNRMIAAEQEDDTTLQELKQEIIESKRKDAPR